MEREFAVQKDLSIRGDEEYGNKQPRTWVKLDINFDATTLQGLIDWEDGNIHEPIFSCNLSRQKIKDIADHPLKVDNYLNHTQSTERAVKLVMEAAGVVCGFERREGYILAPNESRKVVSHMTKRKM